MGSCRTPLRSRTDRRRIRHGRELGGVHIGPHIGVGRTDVGPDMGGGGLGLLPDPTSE